MTRAPCSSFPDDAEYKTVGLPPCERCGAPYGCWERYLQWERERGYTRSDDGLRIIQQGHPTSHEIEGMLVDALEEELENYQDAPKSWSAAHAAIDGLRRRDEEIERLRAEIAKRST